MAVSFNTFIKQKTETAPFLIREKDILACVAPKDHLVTGARAMDSWFTCHKYLLIAEHPIVKPDPVTTRLRPGNFVKRQVRALKEVLLGETRMLGVVVAGRKPPGYPISFCIILFDDLLLQPKPLILYLG